MNYSEAINYIFQKLPIFQRSGSIAYKKDIGNITKACEILKNPHHKFKSIHIAGTNGKGSTAHMIASILYESKYKVGLYTSPHLKDFRERIKINGKQISKNYVINFIKKNLSVFEHVKMSFFEMTVALAFDYFAKKKVDIAIIETGLGGRLDSTNIITPELSVITNISLDHTNLLGDSIEKIAYEKAGIIKKNVPVILGRKQEKIKEIFEVKAQKNNTSVNYAKKTKFEIFSDLEGSYQKENIRTSIATIKELKNKGWIIKDKDIVSGLKKSVINTGFRGRWEILEKSPLTICDTAHNEEGIKNVVKQISKTKYKNLHFILGMVNDKNICKILSLLPKNARYYFCKPSIERGLNEEILQQKSAKFNLNGKCFKNVKLALLSAKKNANKEDVIFISGSTFLVAEIL